jgi:DNA-binding MarR family transcriptional regulator
MSRQLCKAISLYVKMLYMKMTLTRGDAVDELVAEWRRERPDLDVSPLEVLSRVTRLARHLDRARRDAFAAHGLEQWSFDVLAALRRTGAPYELAPRELLERTLVTSGAMTNRIDRLEADLLVERRPDADDRRSVLVRLTAAGAAVVEACLAELLEHERAILAALAPGEANVLAGLLRRLLSPFDEALG